MVYAVAILVVISAACITMGLVLRRRALGPGASILRGRLLPARAALGVWDAFLAAGVLALIVAALLAH